MDKQQQQHQTTTTLQTSVSPPQVAEKSYSQEKDKRTVPVVTEEIVNLSAAPPIKMATTFEEMDKLMRHAEFFRHFSEKTSFMSRMHVHANTLNSEQNIILLCNFFHGENDWTSFLEKYFSDVKKNLQETCLLILITGKLHRFKFLSEHDFCKVVEFLNNLIHRHFAQSREFIQCVRYGNFRCFTEDFSFNPFKRTFDNVNVMNM